MSSSASARDESPRTVRQAASEVALLSVLAVLAGVVLPTFNAASSGENPLAFFNDAGKTVVSTLGAVVPIHAAVLVAFYVVVIGGQILGKPEEAQRLRRLLGLIGELLAAAMAPVVVYTLGYCIASKTEWVAIVIMWFPVIAVEFFFAVQLGVFNFFPMAVRVRILDQKIDGFAARLATLRTERGLPNAWSALFVVVPPAILMTVILTPNSLMSGALTLLLATMFSILVAVVFAIPLYVFRTSFDRMVRVCCWFFPALVYGALMITALTLITAGKQNSMVGWAWFAVLTLDLVSFLIPGGVAPGPLRFISLQFVVGQLAFRRVTYWKRKADSERHALKQKIAASGDRDESTRSKLELFLETVRAR